MSKPDKITLTSSDGHEFEVDQAVAREFEIVAHMLEDGCTGSNMIPITTVDGVTLSRVIEYCKKHVEAGNVEGNVEATKELEDFDKKIVDEDMSTLFKIILAANYLNVKGLLNIACQKVADSIKDKQPEEIRTIFNIENDFTTEEEAEVRKENQWAFE